VTDTLDKFALKLIERVDELGDALIIGVDHLELHSAPQRATDVLRSAIARGLATLESSLARHERLRTAVAERCSFHLLVPMVEAYFFGEPEALTRAGAVHTSRFNPQTQDVEAFVVEHPPFPEADARHPKRYLKFLSDGGYRETKHGVAALKDLSWPTVLATPTFTQSARALIDDIADFFQLDGPNGQLHPETARSTPRRDRVLRNL
jgi:hypothetical protein